MTREEEIEAAAKKVLGAWDEVAREEKKMPRGLNGFYLLTAAVDALRTAVNNPGPLVRLDDDDNDDQEETAIPWYCQCCGYEGDEDDFTPSNRPEIRNCPECSSLDVFFKDKDKEGSE